MDFHLLDEADFPRIHETFLAAFADYAVPVDFDADRLRRMMVRRGTDLSASVGAFDGGRMVAVMATGVRDFEETPTAYDTFTGVRPEFRGQRLAGRMFDVAREELETRGIRRFLLEVIQSNTDAVKAYTRAGFVTRRSFDCWEMDVESLAGFMPPDGVDIRELDPDRTAFARAWQDWSPSWQNSDASIASSVEEVIAFEARIGGQPAGLAIVIPQARDLPRLVVSPAHRRRGIGSALLAQAARTLDRSGPLRAINVDAVADPDRGFFRRIEARPLPSQFEMILDFAN